MYKRQDYDRDKFLTENDLHYVSDQDILTPNDASRYFGLSKIQGDQTLNLAMPIWNWGVFYEKLLQSVLAGSDVYKRQEVTRDLSSAGRASALQAEGHRFEPCRSHPFKGINQIWRGGSTGLLL